MVEMCEKPKQLGDGDYVTYLPTGEHGIIKTMHPDGDKCWVVYRCANEWERFMDFTGALTLISDLKKGWK